MAYFSNSSEGELFADECADCIFGERPCPIAMVQMNYNYEAANNETATDILNDLVKNDGTCMMLHEFGKELRIPDYVKKQQGLFDNRDES
jgi:hypothetical protein